MKSFLILLMILCCLCLPALGEGAGDENLMLPEGDSFQSAAIHQGRLYILGYAGLYTWQLSGDTLEKAADISDQEAAGQLFSHEGGLYVLGESARQVWRWNGEAFETAFRLGSERFKGTDEEGQPVIRELLSACYQAGRLYTLLSSWNFADDEKNTVLCWDMTGKVVSELPAPYVQRLSPAREGRLMAGTAGNEVWALNTATGALEEQLMPASTTWTAGGTAYDPASGRLCYADSGLVYAVSGAEAQPAAYLPVSMSMGINNALFLPDGRYAYGSRGVVMVRRLYAPGQLPQRQTLRISGMVDSELITAFGLSYPQVSVQVDTQGGFGEALRDGLVTRDDSFDLYVVSTEAIGDLKAKGYAAVMDGPALLAETEKLYPQLRTAVTAGEEVIGWPMNLQLETWTVDETLWQELDLGEYPATFDEVLDQMSLWQEAYQEEYPEISYMESWMGLESFLELALRQYVLEHETMDTTLVFDDPAFRQALEAILDNREALQATAGGGDQPLIYAYNMYKGTGPIDSHTVRSLPCPALEAGSPQLTLGRAEVLCVNPAGTNQALAEAFVAFYAAHMAPEDSCWLMPEANDPIRPKTLIQTRKRIEGLISQLEAELQEADPQARRDLTAQLTQRKASLADYLANSYAVSPEDLAVYRQVTEHLVVPVDSLFLSGGKLSGKSAVRTAMNRLMDGEIAIDAFVHELNRVSRMLYGERR